MHEWALADAVVATAMKVAEQQGFKKISEIKIKLGQLQQIERHILKFAIKEIIKPQKSLFKGTRVRFENEEVIFNCRICGRTWTLAETKKLDSTDSEAIHFIPEVVHAYMRCPECKSPDFEIAQGRGFWVESISGK